MAVSHSCVVLLDSVKKMILKLDDINFWQKLIELFEKKMSLFIVRRIVENKFGSRKKLQRSTTNLLQILQLRVLHKG